MKWAADISVRDVRRRQEMEVENIEMEMIEIEMIVLLLQVPIVVFCAIMDFLLKKVYVWCLLFEILLAAIGGISLGIRPVEAVLGCLAGLLFIVFSLLGKGDPGMADSLLILAGGLCLGIWNLLAVLFLAFSIAGLFGLAAMIRGKGRKYRIPFIPCYTAPYLVTIIVLVLR